MQPFAQIPVLEDDGYFLYETIGRYIVQKYPNKGTLSLIPGGDERELGYSERAMSIEATQFLAADQLVYEAAIKPWVLFSFILNPLFAPAALKTYSYDSAYKQVITSP
ncbi:hypothetical protein K438DRAFT_1838763 [Mycena galopus ATCC 62051]|nr:hypothetical protein K438DRAFT_1838763 [Mycena galopus ATCC 62051]